MSQLFRSARGRRAVSESDERARLRDCSAKWHTGEIDSHFSDKYVRDTDTIDLILRIAFQPAPSHRFDKMFLFEGADEFHAHIAGFDNVGNSKVFLAGLDAPHRITSLRISSA